ncbi:MAG: response regulator [Desulfuromonas sp.]|nr:MAG: response regulator [Desulfuromonas sp.]
MKNMGRVVRTPKVGMMAEKNILIVDDSKITRSMAVFSLRNQGFRVLEAAGAAEALELMHREAVDMVITDLRMPDMDGVGLTRKIRSAEVQNDVPIIMITGADHEETRDEAFEAGVSSYLAKPFKPHQLLDLVRSVLC